MRSFEIKDVMAFVVNFDHVWVERLAHFALRLLVDVVFLEIRQFFNSPLLVQPFLQTLQVDIARETLAATRGNDGVVQGVKMLVAETYPA